MNGKNNKNLLLWSFIILVILAAFAMAGQKDNRDQIELTFSEFSQRLTSGEVREVSVQGSELRGKLKSNDQHFYTVGPEDHDALLNLLRESDTQYEFLMEPEQSWMVMLMVNGLPVMLIILLFFLMMRQLQAGSGKAMSFGKSRARQLNESGPKVTFQDVAGAEEAKQELEEIVDFLKDPQKFTKLGARIPKGVLLMGPPGTGKTLLARAVAGEAGVPFFSISGSDFVEMFVGVGASRVRDLFEQGNKNAPCIIFIDEIDAVGRQRGAGLGGGHDEREQTLNQLLVEMDGFEANLGIIIMAATNRPDVLDPALLRPGRFDRRVTVAAPDLKGRTGILKVHVRKVTLGEDVDLEILARGTPGMNGAQLESLVNEAALLAARQDKDTVDMEDFEQAKDKVFLGPARKSMVLSEEVRRRTAYHEAGHAIVGAILPGGNRVHKISIMPRGQSLGQTWYLPDELHGLKKEEFQARIVQAMGGRAAEEVVFDERTTGASDDIRRATQMAHDMVCEYGMSDDLGPVRWGESNNSQIFLGRDLGRKVNYSEATAIAIDKAVRGLLESGYSSAKNILLTNIHILHRVAQSLLEQETLNSEDFNSILESMDPILPSGTAMA